MSAVSIWGGLGVCWNWVLDVVYPGSCHLCGEGVEQGRNLCEACADTLPSLREPFCEVCGECFDGAIESKFACSNCRGQKFAFEFARPAMMRSEGIMSLVHDLKYGRRLELARELAWLSCRAFEDPRLEMVLEEKWPLVPVPLHWKRQHWRQFNQALEVARPLARQLGLPLEQALRRVRSTETQTRLTRVQRQKNLRGAFQIASNFRGARGVVLIDDVFTTGSTVHECSRVLRKAGAQKVVVVTVMRG